ncbi:hypothetical protein BESB_004820 [Besnoitia besnoiti]|uniref:Uncharacterized protein n=1 Tax=Besnoitia besnoiti TaxID=94643 RepID=A0A2A9MNK7_BESBE|nr:hypothetical protein BESB_004820 [Besnoitia besnoiti]PFH38141.1 hypothetical protein BESB_004820 [Besnoitia besnoiti]
MASDDKRSRARSALSRARARLSTLSAFRQAAENYEMMNSKFFGYDTAAVRQDSLRRQLSDPSVGKEPAESRMTAEEEAFAKQHGNKRYISRGLLGEPPPFARNSRGVTVRSGGVHLNEFSRIKMADLRTACALSLLEADMNHYRHLYYEERRNQQVQGRLKFFVAPPTNSTIPDLWLLDHSAVLENIPPPPPEDLEIDRELAMLPDLRQAFALMRQHQVAKLQKRRAVAPPTPAPAPGSTGKVPPSALPGKGAAAALKANQEQRVAEASQPPPVTTPGSSKGAPPGPPGAKKGLGPPKKKPPGPPPAAK